MTTPAVQITGVNFSYDVEPVLLGVNVTVPHLDLAAIVGPNGGGKTTLLKLMLGLLEPDCGEVRVFGEPPREVTRRLGYVPQGFSYDRRLPITALDVAMMGRLGAERAFGPWAGDARARARTALETVGVAELADRRFVDASAGQQQRVLIARALTTDPEMLMLDEPTSSLDVGAEREIYELLQQLNEQITIVLVTHDLGFVSNVVKSVLCVNRHVKRHPTTGIGEITGELLEEMYGSDLRVVRHDQSDEAGYCRE
ncbi:MAG: metal ABC transporter ATP-binding protein [Armatimonadota bacterium]|jgi:zinc transport system ATP-binding protein